MLWIKRERKDKDKKRKEKKTKKCVHSVTMGINRHHYVPFRHKNA